MANVQFGQIVQTITLEREQHRAAAEQLQNEIAQLEETLEQKQAAFHREVGAMNAKNETINSLQALARQSAGNPDSDPNAHSDQ